MKLLLALLSLVTLASCAPAEEEAKKANKNLKNVTDYSVCGSSSRGMALPGTWTITQVQDDFKILTTLDIHSTQATLTNDCLLKGQSLVAMATSRISYRNNRLEFLHHDYNESVINEPDFKMNCSIEINPAVMTYSFQGRCLVLQNSDSKLVWVPQR